MNIMIAERLIAIKQANLHRDRIARAVPQNVEVVWRSKHCINFSSNDYLNLANHPQVKAATIKGIEQYGVGSGASALVTGYTDAHAALEQQFANFLQRDKAIFFSCGYMANLAVLSCLSSREGIIYQDKFNHASLLDAALLSQAKQYRYRHHDINHLEAMLIKYSLARKVTKINKKINHSILVTDAVFSMQGDIAPLPQLATLAQRYHTSLIVDDAHGIGVIEKEGRGSLALFALNQQQVPLLICPLGKAFGCYGAIVAGQSSLIDYLMQTARSYIYTTALPAALACAASVSLQLVQDEEWRRQRLNTLIYYFRELAAKYELPILPSITAIQICEIGDAATAMKVSEQLWQRGILVMAMRPPTVPAKRSCLRITLTCGHTEEQIARLVLTLGEVMQHNQCVSLQ